MDEEASTSDQLFKSLDNALHELGILGSIETARKDCLYELRRKCLPSQVVQKNLHFVSEVRVGVARLKMSYPDGLRRQMGWPYGRCFRERTQSENAEITPIDTTSSTISSIAIEEKPVKQKADMCVDLTKILSTQAVASSSPLKKAKSLESVAIENDYASQSSHEMEFVSSRIQKLKMNDS